jgi:hypothetical protein
MPWRAKTGFGISYDVLLRLRSSKPQKDWEFWLSGLTSDGKEGKMELARGL